jgi:hypothetical protein
LRSPLHSPLGQPDLEFLKPRQELHELFLRLGTARYIEDVLKNRRIPKSGKPPQKQKQKQQKQKQKQKISYDVRLAGAKKPASNGKPPRPRDRTRGGSTLQTLHLFRDAKKR